jgi:anti-sigma B factor antagonist
MEFSIRRDDRGALPLLRVRGELDLLTAPRLLDAVQAALSGDAGSIAFDFSEVSFIDSFGLSVLVTTKRQIAERGGEVYILGVTGHVARVFNVIQVGDQFCLCDEEELPAPGSATTSSSERAGR